MSKFHLTNKEIMVAAALGSLLVSASALILAPKTGHAIRENLSNFYDGVADRTHEMTDSMIRKSKCLVNMNCDEPDWADKAKSLLCDMSKYMSCAKKKGMDCGTIEDHAPKFILGALAGCLIGAVAGLVVAPKPGNKLRNDISHAYDDFSDKTHEYADNFQRSGKKFAKNAKKQANVWLDLASTLINEFVDKAEDANEHVTETVKDYTDAGKAKIDQALEWASLGLRIWNGISKNR